MRVTRSRYRVFRVTLVLAVLAAIAGLGALLVGVPSVGDVLTALEPGTWMVLGVLGGAGNAALWTWSASELSELASWPRIWLVITGVLWLLMLITVLASAAQGDGRLDVTATIVSSLAIVLVIGTMVAMVTALFGTEPREGE